MYDKESNGKTVGKILSRDQITNYAIQLANQKGLDVIKAMTLPSNVGIQEAALFNHFQEKLELFCVEQNDDVYDKVNGSLPEGTNYWNMSFQDAAHHLEKCGIKMDFLWFDACGYFKTFAKDFINAVRYNMQDDSLAFFTAKVTSRQETSKDLYNYYRLDQPEKAEVTSEDLVSVYMDYLQWQLPTCRVFYDLTYKTSSGQMFVVFGVAKGDVKVRKYSRYLEPKTKTDELTEKQKLMLALYKKGVTYEGIAEGLGLSNGNYVYYHISKQIKTYGHRKSTTTFAEAMKEINKKEEGNNMDTKTVNKILSLIKQGQNSEEIASTINMGKMQVAGIKASIARGTYGEQKKNDYKKALQGQKVAQLIEDGKSDEYIVSKTGVTVRSLGAFKAHVTRKA